MLKNKHYIIKPYDSKTEKSILECNYFIEGVEAKFNNICRLLNVPVELDDRLKMAYIYKLRAISFGDDLDILYKCPHCSRATETIVSLDNLLDFNEEYDYNIVLKDGVTLSDIMNAKPSTCLKLIEHHTCELNSLIDVNKLYIGLRSIIPTFNKPKAKCLFCQAESTLEVWDKAYLIDTLSSYTVQSIYQVYNVLAYNGFPPSDVDKMLPFERTFHYNVCQQRIQEQKQSYAVRNEILKS